MTEIAEVLNRLPFVRWDRCVRPGDWLIAYGWIDRDDGRADFVVVEFFEGDLYNAVTSSARYSVQVTQLLFGGEETVGHKDCEPISDVLAGVHRTIARTDMMPSREVMEAILGDGSEYARREAA